MTELGFDLDLTGFDQEEIGRLLAPAPNGGLVDPDEVPDPVEEPVSVHGDVWILGEHRLMCGDSTSADDVSKLLSENKPVLMVTDPPYGVNYDADWRNRSLRSDGKPIGGRAVGKVLNDDNAKWSDCYKLFPGDVAYVWHPPGPLQVDFFKSLVDSGFEIRNQIIWAKSQLVIGRGHYHQQHEPCWYAVKKGSTANWCGDRKQTTLWQIPKPQKNETGHSTQKPVECMKIPILNNTHPGQSVYEPFSGSGTTIIACEMTGRKCLAMELNPAYVDIAVKRWEVFSGGKAVLENRDKDIEQ